MEVTIGTVLSWVVVGALSGSIVGYILKGRKGGYGIWKNLAIGLVGAVIGWFIFLNLLNLDFGLRSIQVTAADLVAGIVGAFIFVGIIAMMSRGKGKKDA